MDASRAAGFWSYTHADNDAEAERITRLAKRVEDEYGLITGAQLDLFVDRAINWGEEWRARIDQALTATTFFIPVVTPRYFRSAECRRELLTFAGEARSLGLEELLLPLIYADVPGLASDADDEAIALVARTHYEDWRPLRLLDEGSAEYRQGVNRLAARLAEISASVDQKPDRRPPAPAAESSDDLAPGFLERLAEGEEALPRWTETIEAFPEPLQEVSRLMEEATRRVQESDARGGSFAARLAISRSLASSLQDPAARIAALGKAYAADLVAIDPAILTLLREAEENPAVAAEDVARTFFHSLRGLVSVSRETAASVQEFWNALEGAAQASRELKAPIATIREGLRGVLDGMAILEEWDRRISRLYDERLDGSAG